ncbi:hypothetical protein, partial [Streptomyces sp. YIM 98790]|uniref:hypothetical protein n=1 Tax=Streptomyces sp. YIM 98790 TaxID=2689077 RepID=UPI00140DF755
MPVPGGFPFPDAADGTDDHEDEDLLMPGSHGTWGETVSSYGTPASGTPTPVFATPADGTPAAAPAHPAAPEPGAAQAG